MSKQFFRKMIEFFPNSEIEYNNMMWVSKVQFLVSSDTHLVTFVL